MSPALPGRLFTTEPPGKPKDPCRQAEVESCIEDTLYVDEQTENGVSDYIIGTKTAISSDEKMDVAKYTFKLKEGAQADNVSVTLTKADTVNLENTDNGATADDIKASMDSNTSSHTTNSSNGLEEP